MNLKKWEYAILMANQSKEKNNSVDPFFSHDIGTRQSGEIKKLLIAMGWEGYGLWWAIVEYMHRNPFPIEDESVLAYDFRCDEEKIHQIMNNFGLFEIRDGYYVSDRILRNLNYRVQKSGQNQEAANIRWLISTFNKCYEEEFGEAPTLDSSEIETLKKYSKRIPNLKELLPDIIFTLKGLKFDTDVKFVPTAHWLLKSNNLTRLIDGEFGKLKHRKTEKELKAEQEEIARKEAEYNQPHEVELKVETCSGKTEALVIIADYYKEHQLIETRGKLLLFPPFKTLIEKFDITDNEVKEACQQ